MQMKVITLPPAACFKKHAMLCSPGVSHKADIHRKKRSRQQVRAEDEDLTPAQKAVQDRIRKAMEYKTDSQLSNSKAQMPSQPSAQSATSQLSTNKPVMAETSAADLEQVAMDEYSKRLMDYGAQLASSQQQALSDALQDMKANQPPDASESDEAQRNAEMLQQARQLAAEKADAVNASLYAQINRTTAVPMRDTFSRAKDGTDGSGNAMEESPEELKNREAALSGNANEAASYLKRVMTNTKSEDANLRPEQFTLKRDEEMKARGVDFVASDKGYNPLLQADPDAYKPKSTSWGMYPRPKDISKAYGGGRTYKPGEALESSEQEESRRNKTAAALLEYRKKMGLFIDADSEAKWTAVYQNGAALMQGGQLGAAMNVFEEVIQNVSTRTKLGGEAQLQRAICLDSLGKNEEAYKLYMQLERHPSPEVQKRTKRMIFGFRAAENLKANTMSYAIGAKGSKEWDKYFTKLAGEWDSGYVGESEDSTLSTVIAASVILLPIAFIAYLILT